MEAEISGNVVVVIVGAITALIAAGVTAYKTVRETDAKVKADEKASELAEEELDLKALGVKADVSEKLQNLYQKMTEDFDKKFCVMQKEIEELRAQVEEDKRIQGKLLADLELSRKSDRTKAEAGILLIRAIEQALAMHEKPLSPSDEALMCTLQEVRVLFKNGNPS